MFTYVSQGEPDVFGLLPAGIYPAVVTKAELGQSRASGNPMLTVTLRATSKEGMAQVDLFLVNTAKSIWKIDRFLYALGSKVEAGKAYTLDHRLVGRQCFVKLSVEQGEKRNFNSIVDTMSKEEAAGIIAATQAQAAPGNQRPAAQAAPPEAPPEDDGDEIPF